MTDSRRSISAAEWIERALNGELREAGRDVRRYVRRPQ
ncbi:hypothetical protein OEIGOIKO_07974 [Streptomyces chrestomyceticus JCM 4735]|uniref:Uncharacterized protein n=1 Tax=Streptomyces chrestomyceticus JCM 4735 TaxID=1306181 RepID=A0A7U9Q130_9ACTN|nr:hypothetical protein OEIGOIKO_07974 [Streptomyces chrestomyceticus JCM 4735]